MIKKIFAASISIMLIICIAVSTHATGISSIIQIDTNNKADKTINRFVDDASLLDYHEEEELVSCLNEISERQQCDVVIVTVNSLDGKTATAYADDYFDYNGYGFGANNDGILFLISMGEREWAISTTGACIDYFTDNGLDSIEDEVIQYLSDGEYSDAFMQFAKLCDEFITQGKTGDPYDTDNVYVGERDWGMTVFIAVAAGIVLAFVVTLGMKAKLKSVRMQDSANNYVRADSMSVSLRNDMFLGRSVVRTAIPKNDCGGGSSTHSGSSGTSHGGSSGRF